MPERQCKYKLEFGDPLPDGYEWEEELPGGLIMKCKIVGDEIYCETILDNGNKDESGTAI